MRLVRFLFPFLFIRNWQTGEVQLSRPRVMLFCTAAACIVFALVVIAILQVPIEYTAT